MGKSLLDTDILSEIFKGRNPTVTCRAVGYRKQFGQYTLSTITVMEVVRGYHAAGQHQRLAVFQQRLAQADVLVFGQTTADLAGRIYADLERSGLTIGRADPMIAATAIEHDLTLVTGNTSHFERIQNLGYPLRLDNWRVSTE